MVERIEPPFVDLRAADWTGAGALQAGAGRAAVRELGELRRRPDRPRAAVRYARGLGLEAIEARVTALAARLRGGAGGAAGVSVHDPGARRCGIVSFRVAGEAPEATARRLAARGHQHLGDAGAGGADRLRRARARAVVRASVHYFNTEDEVDRFVAAVGGAMNRDAIRRATTRPPRNPAPERPALEGEVAAEVCIVGAGFTGLSAALELAERGHQVVMLEAAKVGWGASGRNGGQIVNGLNAGPRHHRAALWRGDGGLRRRRWCRRAGGSSASGWRATASPAT